MPYEIMLPTPIDGISLSNSEGGEDAEVMSRAFLTDAHGEMFYRILEQFDNSFLKEWKKNGLPVSVIDNYLVLIRKQKATVYVNELNRICDSIFQRKISAGDSVTLEDIIGIISVNFPELPIPEDVSIVFYFSERWKRGLFFDFTPNQGNKLQDINYILATYHEELLYSHILYIQDNIWEHAYELGWFPFISLLGDADSKLQHLLGRIREGKATQQSEERLIEFFDAERLSVIHERLNNNAELKPHIQIINAGMERYLAGDYVSAINNVWPRIEGILRYIYLKFHTGKPSQSKLADYMMDVVTNKTLSPGVFFPEKFRCYLLKFYFRDFDLATNQLNVSRHSIGHGVSDTSLYNKKHALLGLLMVDQLGFYIRRPLTAPL